MQEYTIRRLIGQGAFGEVFLATDRRSNRKVAIKKLSKALLPTVAELDRAMQELSILSSLNHANVIKLLEVVSDDVSVGLVMEYAGARGRRRRRLRPRSSAHAPFPASLLRTLWRRTPPHAPITPALPPGRLSTPTPPPPPSN